MKLVSGIVDSGFFAQSALSAEVATKDSLGRNISETYLTGVDIPESANWNGATTVVNNNSAIWNNTTNIVSANSAQWASGGTANPQIPVTGINGIKISESGDQVVFEVSADYAVADDLTGKQDSLTFGYKDTAISSIDSSALYDNSAHARITTLAGRISNLSSNKLDSSAFSDVSGSFLTAVGDTYLQNTDLTIADGKVTEISGVPLSAGDELPSGVMNTSALEYNAVNEISGYNGSAIAQYGAEKQWLVHDDTLVHVANSAQYALGCNVSALQRLMCIDETVLYSGNLTGNGATAQLSEPIQNFEKIKVYGHTDDGIQDPWFIEFYPVENLEMAVGVATNNHGWAKWFNFTITTGGLYKNVTGRVLTFGTTTWGDLTNYGMTRVIGIGRKQ